MQTQQTIAEKVSCTGIGLHSGAPVQLTLLPARADTGIVIVRSDGGRSVEIPAHAKFIASSQLATTLGRGADTVRTVEHLLAALHGLGVDNARVVIEGPELPVMDGSAASFVYLVRSAGLFAQPERRRGLRLRRPVEVRLGERWIRAEPAREFRISYAIDFEHPAIGRQCLEIVGRNPAHFEREVAGARTFGFLRQVKTLWDAGLAKGGSLDNTLVLDDEGVINPEGLRWPDEFVRHKVLDLYGDLMLLGTWLQAHIRVERGGHALHLALVSEILESPAAWRVLGRDHLNRALVSAVRAPEAP
ncbi:MAG: UDP-3-O-acyl-N-acetylglucosamine deacetylase [Myxococcota bacterium]|nr:UDP-3-O-acyl-N-acetylglucosamine deacetylase [Myxococcota bacterium]MDP7571245.1 UDP-3-O-acyl-N-acetylglucosamine deacetylase [Myxococcota bacterium]